MNVSGTINVCFFMADGITHLLSVLNGALADGDFSCDDRLFGDVHLFPAHGNADRFVLTDRGIRDLTRSWTTLDIHFLMGNRNVNIFLFGDDLFMQIHLSCLDRLLIDLELLLTPLETASLSSGCHILGGGSSIGLGGSAGIGHYPMTSIRVIATILGQDRCCLLHATITYNSNDAAPSLILLLVVTSILRRHAHRGKIIGDIVGRSIFASEQ